jgi:glutamate carboxypeptidase
MNVAELPFDAEVMLAKLRPWVECESPTWDAAAVNRMMAVASHDLHLLRADIATIPGRDGFGDCLRAQLPHPDRGRPGILVLGHMDTVHPIGTLDVLPWRREGDRCYGPGICDMKGGNLICFEALRLLASCGIPTPLPVTLLLTSDEEAGSPSTRELIEAEAAYHRYVLVPEPARRNGDLVSGRYAIARIRIEVRGKSSHAGAHPSEGVSALSRLAHLIPKIEKMSGENCSFSVGVARSGEWVNCVSEFASAEVLVMAKTQSDLDSAVEELTALSLASEEVHISVRLYNTRPIWNPTKATIQLVELAQAIGADLGIEFGHESSGGGSDANFTGAMGVPTLDGLGVEGDGYHTKTEHIIVDSLPQRARLIAGLLTNLA